MKPIIVFLLISAFVFCGQRTCAQTFEDTIQANKYIKLAEKYSKNLSYDSSTVYLRKAAYIYKSIAENQKDTVSWGKYLECLGTISTNFTQQYQLEASKNALDSALTVALKIFGSEHQQTALVYHNYGVLFYFEAKYDQSLEYLFKEAGIYKRNLTKDHGSLARNHLWIGMDYLDKGELDTAMDFTNKCIEILKEKPEENNPDLADAYNQMASVCFSKSEFEKALEYYLISLAIYKKAFGEKDNMVANGYNNLGNTYNLLSENDKALASYLESLEIKSALITENNIGMATLYENIGDTYSDLKEYDKALEYTLKGLKIESDLLGEKHVNLGYCYINLGNIYKKKCNYAKALDCYLKSLGILSQLLGQKQQGVVFAYYNIGSAYSYLSDNYEALLNYQKGIASFLPTFNDTINVFSTPKLNEDTNWRLLLEGLQGKAQILADTEKSLNKGLTLTDLERQQVALEHYKACNTLIDLARKKMGKQSDKIALGKLASEIYEGAVGVCLNLATTGPRAEVAKYKQLAFYYSEKNKSAVLLEALAGQEAQKFAGIPESLLKAEHKLQTDIAFYTKQLAGSESLDSVIIATYQQLLFNSNRSYDSLIVVFEKKYPKYHELKYNVNTASVKDVQRLIDKKTAMLSYFVGDSTITTYTVTKNSYNVVSVQKPLNLEKSISYFRNSLTRTNKQSELPYKKYGSNLYEMLFPKDLDKSIENLIIVPDGVLATIPFEALLTSKAADTAQFRNLPYLVKKYSISYCSSATLFAVTFPKKKEKTLVVKPLNDWISYAPVFDDQNGKGISLASRALIGELHKIDKDSTSSRGLMRGSGKFIPPLPGSESEVRSIFNEFDKENFKTKVELKENASESRIKSGELENYKYIHFATHGFVNSEKPELSGLLLAQVADSTNEQNDGILYSGEIYNLKLNADLVVLSACETGLGKIKKGEGIIGLTRALLYAGAKNLMVSLWQVSDKSTSDLMISFYKNLLSNNSTRLTKSVRYAPLLQQAKLKMIGDAKFAHPFYWSPFILIGQ
ncbi:MAG: CHAT domain-containing tetratricopeptide repeat protein [Mariniphaga sp.]